MDTKDTNWRSFIKQTGTITEWENPADPSQYDDLFKGSECKEFGAEGITIVGGSREDSIDCVRGKNYLFKDCEVLGSITIKGSIDGWSLEGCKVHAQVEVGQFDNYWYPFRKPTRNGIIYQTVHGGSVVKVRLWDADMPALIETEANVTKIPWVVWFPYFCWRYVAIRTWDRP